MCEPVTMSIMAAGTLAMAAGQIMQGKARAKAQRYNATVEDINAQVSERQALDSIERGKLAEQQKRIQIGDVIGRQKVAFASGGVDLGFGSPADTIVDTAVMGELDALTVRSNAYREAEGHRVNALNRRAGANMSRAAAVSALNEGFLSAGGTVLTGASRVAGIAYG